MRVVLDTNVLARATPGRNSAARQLLDVLLQSPHVLVSSEFLLSELGRALRYDRVRAIHGLDDPAIDAYVQAVRDASLVVVLPATAAVATDPDDDAVIATAIEGQADVLCTWDKHLFAPAVQQYLAPAGVRVLRDTDLLRELQSPST
jgi:putative PIN family toxin of toxin-antitoxin system